MSIFFLPQFARYALLGQEADFLLERYSQGLIKVQNDDDLKHGYPKLISHNRVREVSLRSGRFGYDFRSFVHHNDDLDKLPPSVAAVTAAFFYEPYYPGGPFEFLVKGSEDAAKALQEADFLKPQDKENLAKSKKWVIASRGSYPVITTLGALAYMVIRDTPRGKAFMQLHGLN
ncbi:hypothetical protein HOC01_02040 [archaeon]|nr:hypothetical protein [archaeon]MBT6697899.1 hypothetical protein [archaeon]